MRSRGCASNCSGLSFTPQHSDARVLDQIVYKWQHSRRVIAQALVDKYSDLAQTGWQVSRAEIERDVKDLFGGAFERFCQIRIMPGLIAIVGRPNVGKSALFNRIAGRRIAIVHDQPGVTRDRITAEVEWRGRPFTLVDTGGIGLLRREKADDVIVKAALEQVELAIEAADVIILVVNVQEGVVPLDREAAARLRHSGKPVLVAVNKVDTHRAENAAWNSPSSASTSLSRQRDSWRRHSSR